MKKFFTLIAVAVMALASQAATLTVADGYDWSSQYPVYGWYYDADQALNQMIYPAELIGAMNGGKITQVKFYADALETINFYGGEVQLSMMEVDETGFATSMYPGTTVVATIHPVAGEIVLVFDLDAPYEYKGGNLLIQTEVTETGVAARTYFRGKRLDYKCAYSQYYWWYLTTSTDNFLPMATFTYEEGGEVLPTQRTDSPSASKVNYVEKDGEMYYNAYTVTLTPAETEPDCTIWYRIGVMEDGEYVYGGWMEYVAPFDVNVPGNYRIEAYAITEGKLESYPIADEFVVSRLTDVEELFAGKTVADVRYFNVAGQEMQQADGLTIVVTTYTDGTQSAVKVVK